MPLYESQIPNLENTVSKPIALQAALLIRNNFFADTTLPIHLIDQTGNAMEFGSSTFSKNDILLDTNSIIQVRYTEIPEQDIILTTIVDSGEMRPIWLDESLDVYARPIKSYVSCKLTITYRGSTKQEVDNWLNFLYTKFARGGSSLPMNLRYEMSVPDGLLVIIKAVHDARETNAGYGDSFQEYLENNLQYAHDYKVNQLGGGTTLVMRDMLCNVVARLEPEIPVPTREDNNTYTADVEFNFRYDKPSSMIIDYPIFVHNSYINPDFFDTDLDRNKIDKYQYTSDYGLISGLSYLLDKRDEVFLTRDGYIFPAFDPWKPQLGDRCLLPLIQMQIAVDPDNKTLLLDLTTLELATGLTLHKDLIDYWIRCGEDVFKYGRSAYWFGVYRNGQLLNSDRYTVNQVGQAVASYDLNLRGNYHLVIGLNTELGLLGMSGYDTLANFGELAVATIATIEPSLPRKLYPPLITIDALRPTTMGASIQNTVEAMYTCRRYGVRRDMYTVNTIAIMN